MKISNKVKRVINKLQNLYKIGIIKYPRVDNNFIEEAMAYDMMPHQSLSLSSALFEEIKGEKPVLNKKNSILFLSILRIMSPSNIEGYADLVDSFFDDELNFVSEEQEKLANSLIDEFFRFIDEEDISQKELLEMYRDIYEQSRSRDYVNYEIEGVTLMPEGETRIYKLIPKMQKSRNEKALNDAELISKEYQENIKPRASLMEALDEFDEMVKVQLEVAKKIQNKLNDFSFKNYETDKSAGRRMSYE